RCTTTGEIFVGANIEPVIPTLGICAERVALASALSAGHRVFEAIAVVTPEEKGIFPCGACRQMLFEFGGPELHVLAVGSELTQRVLLHSLLPEGFRGTNKT
ncbi:cytidine deaminase, partial [bacterium]|nr:cytidine deaminase [bacterium]